MIQAVCQELKHVCPSVKRDSSGQVLGHLYPHGDSGRGVTDKSGESERVGNNYIVCVWGGGGARENK